MATYTEKTDTFSKPMLYLKPKEGYFHTMLNDQPEKWAMIEGTLDLVRIQFDAGNPKSKIEPHDAFVMHVSDDEYVYRIKMPLNRNFVFSIAKVLDQIEKGDTIRLSTKCGDDKTVTFCNIVKQSPEGNWERLTQIEMPKDDRVEMTKQIIENHSAYSPKLEKDSS